MGERKPCTPPSVYELIASRTKRIQQKKGINDGYTLELMLPGGGPGAAAQAGFLWAMQDRGIHRVVNRITSVSVGTIHGAYFAAGQVETGLQILSDHMNSQFFKLGRFFRKGENVANINYIVDDVMTKHAPLLWRRRRQDLLHPFATNAYTAEAKDLAVVFDGLKTARTIRQAARLSGTPPVFGEKHVIGPDGREYEDGGLAARGMPPWKESTATHLLVLLPRPERTRRKRSLVDQLGAFVYLCRRKPAIAKRISRYEKDYFANVQELYAARDDPNYPAQIEIVQLPRRHKMLGTFVTNKELIMKTVAIAYEHMKEKLEANLPVRRPVAQPALT